MSADSASSENKTEEVKAVVDDGYKPTPEDWRELWRRSERNRQRSMLAFAISAVAGALVIALVVVVVFFLIGQNKTNRVLDEAGCRAILAAENDASTTDFFATLVQPPIDRAKLDAIVDRLNRIKNLRKDEDPCAAVQRLPEVPPLNVPGGSETSVPPTTLPPSTTRSSGGGTGLGSSSSGEGQQAAPATSTTAVRQVASTTTTTTPATTTTQPSGVVGRLVDRTCRLLPLC